MTNPPLIDDGFLDEQPIPSSKPYRLVPDSPRRGCSVLGFLVLALVFAIAACGAGAGKVSVPFDKDVPTGGTVIYTADHSRIGFLGYPVRIVQLVGRCITEVYSEDAWTFVSSDPCATPSGESDHGNLRPVVGQALRGAPLVNVTGKPTDPTLGEWPVLHGHRDQSDAAGRVRAAVRQSQDASAVTFEGTLAYALPSYGPLYLAIRQPRGTRVVISGPSGSVERHDKSRPVHSWPEAIHERPSLWRSA